MSEPKTTSLDVPPDYALSVDGQTLYVTATGAWTLDYISEIDAGLVNALDALTYDTVKFDFNAIKNLDTAGAYVLARAVRCDIKGCHAWDVIGKNPGHETLMRAAADAAMGREPAKAREWYDTLARLGEATSTLLKEGRDTLSFLGEFMIVFMRLIVRPNRIRWASVFSLIEDVGLNAAPIVIMLSFFIGAVIAYMGANLLATVGFQVFMVDLVGFSMLRELAVIITAILLAGRSASAFTAKLGAMKMRQEIDAMQVIGMDKFETLVVPRAIACLIAAPVLTFLAMMSGLSGGMIVAWVGPTDISPILFFARLREVVDISHFWVGMVKSPFFALIIAIIGCRHGLAVTGSVDSLGTRTTTSVVQAIFTVITVDAVFAMVFLEIGI